MSEPAVIVAAFGDIFVNRKEPEASLAFARPLAEAADVVFGNCEGVYTDTDALAPSCGFRVAAPMRNMAVLDGIAFDVMALANNHMIDAGHDAFVSMLDALDRRGIATLGAGRTLAEARAPRIVNANGIRVGFLSYTTVYQAGYPARAGVPGVSALRVHSVPYFPDWDPYGRVEPGAQPHMRTFPYPEDVARLEADIAELRRKADTVLVSMHWGDSRLPVVLTDYECILGHAAIEAGADAILGHHHHFLKAVEFYQGKPIFYGLGHFAFDLTGLESIVAPEDVARLRAFSEWAIFPRAESPGYPFHRDTRFTGVALLGLAPDGSVRDIGFAPFYIGDDNRTVPLRSDGGPDAATAYLMEVTQAAGFETGFAPGPDLGGCVTWRCLAPALPSDAAFMASPR